MSYIHSTSVVESGAIIGKDTKIWHFSHIYNGAKIGSNCSLGQNTMVSDDVVIGNNVKVQNNVSIYKGVIIEDNVFLGPSCVLTNISNPRSEINRQQLYEKTLIQKGVTIGANATILPGITLGCYSFISAGAVVTRNTKDYAFMKGVPARQEGWMSRHGHVLSVKTDDVMICPESGYRYKEFENGLRCLDLNESYSLPENLKIGKSSYQSYKNNI